MSVSFLTAINSRENLKISIILHNLPSYAIKWEERVKQILILIWDTSWSFHAQQITSFLPKFILSFTVFLQMEAEMRYTKTLKLPGNGEQIRETSTLPQFSVPNTWHIKYFFFPDSLYNLKSSWKCYSCGWR